MLIDSTHLMYETFQSCRHALENAGALLNLLRETLEVVKQQKTYTVEIPDHWAEPLNEYTRRAILSTSGVEPTTVDSLSPENQQFFSLVYIGTHELIRLWASESKPAVRSIGYALHVIPDLLRKPQRFDRRGYWFCFRIVSTYWTELSLEMQHAFCKIMGLELKEARELINRENFPVKW